MPVVALIATAADEEDPEGETEPAFLHYVSASSNDLASLVQARHADYKLAYSGMAGMSYYANHCPHCGKFSGDHFVMGPDGPFFPDSDTPAVVYELLPIETTLDLDCSPAWGVAAEILSTGRIRS